jgi:large subunit ribosomal protein L9
MIADEINRKLGTTIDRRQIEVQPIRTLGEHSARIRLTIDLVPEVKIFVHREGEAVQTEEVVETEPVEEASEEATEE